MPLLSCLRNFSKDVYQIPALRLLDLINTWLIIICQTIITKHYHTDAVMRPVGLLNNSYAEKQKMQDNH